MFVDVVALVVVFADTVMHRLLGEEGNNERVAINSGEDRLFCLVDNRVPQHDV